MIITVKRWFAVALLTTCITLARTVASAADDWQVIKINGHDYLSVDNIARFYRLPAEVAPSGAKIRFETVKNPLEFVSGSREVMINGARCWLCFPLVEQNGKFLVARTDVAKTIEPQLRPHRVPNAGKVETVVLDAGHGGHDKGAVSRYGNEKDFALDVARKLRPLLQAKGLRVIMTREGDYFVPLEVRAQIAGSEVDAQSMALSACVYHSLLGHIPEFDRGIKRARFAVLRLTRVPAVLVEGGFLTERGESKLIAMKDWRAKLAQAISIGIENYHALGVKKQPPMLVADYRRQTKSVAAEPVTPEADLSLVNLIGESALAPMPAKISPSPSQQRNLPTTLESAVIIP